VVGDAAQQAQQAVVRLDEVPPPVTTTAGNGECPSSSRRSTSRMASICGECRELSGCTGRSRPTAAAGCGRAAAGPDARRGAAPSSRLGMDRPVSRKLRCRVDTPVRDASSSWLRRRRVRHPRIRSPRWWAWQPGARAGRLPSRLVSCHGGDANEGGCAAPLPARSSTCVRGAPRVGTSITARPSRGGHMFTLLLFVPRFASTPWRPVAWGPSC
jgi:hypothetical protein